MPEKCYLCILDASGNVLLHRNIAASPESFLKAVAPFREGLVVGVECMFAWYWLFDLCDKEGIDFVLGHALFMKAIHGGKAKNDKIDSQKIAVLLRGGSFPVAYAYPPKMRATRDLLGAGITWCSRELHSWPIYTTLRSSTTCRRSASNFPARVTGRTLISTFPICRYESLSKSILP